MIMKTLAPRFAPRFDNGGCPKMGLCLQALLLVERPFILCQQNNICWEYIPRYICLVHWLEYVILDVGWVRSQG